MKKLSVIVLVVLFLTVSGSAMAQNQGYFEAQIGADVLGNLDVSGGGVSSDEDTDAGISLTGEYKIPLENNSWVLGAGLNYQLARAVDASGAEDFNFTSFYGLAQYDLNDTPMYIIGKLGYNTFSVDNLAIDEDENGGLYYGVGAGFNFGENDQYVLEGLYSVNNGELEDGIDTIDVEYSKFTVAIGMTF